MKKLLAAFSIIGLLLFAQPAQAEQTTMPSFPSCPAVEGQVIASYESGMHWIVGESSLRPGSDTVYRLEDGNVIQCFCPVEGDTGIQTNWVAAPNLTEGQKSYYEANGWIVVENGADFGLNAHPYLAKNIPSSCSTPTPSCTPAPSTPISAPVSGEKVCEESKPTPTPGNAENGGGNGGQGSQGGETLGVTTGPKILAPTGVNQIWQTVATLIASLTSIGYGIYLKKKS